MQETSDLYLAAAMKAAGVALDTIRRDKQRAVFVFTTTIDSLSAAYYRGDLTLSARLYADEIRGLKAAIAGGWAGR